MCKMGSSIFCAQENMGAKKGKEKSLVFQSFLCPCLQMLLRLTLFSWNRTRRIGSALKGNEVEGVLMSKGLISKGSYRRGWWQFILKWVKIRLNLSFSCCFYSPRYWKVTERKHLSHWPIFCSYTFFGFNWIVFKCTARVKICENINILGVKCIQTCSS